MLVSIENRSNTEAVVRSRHQNDSTDAFTDPVECLSGLNISLRAPVECQEEVGGWEFFLHSINKAIRIFGFFEFFFKS